MRTIFRFVRGILRMAWSLFWGFFWTIAISFLVLVGIIYFTDSPSSGMDGVGRAAQKVVYQVGNLFGDQGFASRFGMTPSSQTTQTDNHEHSGARWEKAEATVYLDPNISQTFVKAYRDAIEAWNQTGAFTFKFVTNEKEANVVLTEMDNASVSAAGETASQTNLLTNRFTHITVRLNRHYLLNYVYNYSYDRIVNTAEHELGHAIGLDHTDGESVMQPAGSFYSIQDTDVEAVRQLYKEE